MHRERERDRSSQRPREKKKRTKSQQVECKEVCCCSIWINQSKIELANGRECNAKVKANTKVDENVCIWHFRDEHPFRNFCIHLILVESFVYLVV